MDDQDLRLNRIEEKLDKVGEAIISMARMEEKMITLFNRMDAYDKKQGDVEKRLGGVELNQASNAWVERIVMLVIGATVAYLFKGF